MTDETPPTLADLEYAWSLQPSAGADFMLGVMAIALARAGGFQNLQRELVAANTPCPPARDPETGEPIEPHHVARAEPAAGEPEMLDPIVYERVNVDGVRVGWRVPEHERERWDAPRPPIDRPPVDTETLSYEAILDLLEPWAPSFDLRARLAVAHHADPVRVSRMTAAILGDPDVRDPTGVLYVRLGKLAYGDT